MKTIIAASLLALAASSAMAADVGVSISVGQPGFYGRINIGDFPQPSLIYAEPVIVQRPVRYVGQPIYLRVPPGHAKKWSKHCRSYNACGQEVYFVQDNWYLNEYAPRYRGQHRDSHDRDDHRGRGNDRHDDRRDRHDDRGDKHDKHGNGHGKGHGKD
jgi:hypothetical protein